MTFCGHCKDEVKANERGMSCERCEVWFHVSCVNINTALYDLLVNQVGGEDDGFRWYCPTCRGKGVDGPADTIKATIQKEIKDTLPTIVKHVLTETKECAEILSKTYSDVVKKQQNKMIDETVKATSNLALKESMKSLESNLAQKKRTRNVVISGIDEYEQENTSDIAHTLLKPLEHRLQKCDILKSKRIGSKSEAAPTAGTRLVESLECYLSH